MVDEQMKSELIAVVNRAYEAGAKMGVADQARQEADAMTKEFVDKYCTMDGAEDAEEG